MFKIGTVCMKIAGRDAGELCVVIEEPSNGRVLVEGATRRKAVNMHHLEPTTRSVNVKKGASHQEVMKALGLAERSSKAKPAKERPVKARASAKASSEPKAAAPKKAKPAAKKAAAKKQAKEE